MKIALYITTEISAATLDFLYQHCDEEVSPSEVYPYVRKHISEKFPDFDLDATDPSGESVLNHYTRWSLNSLSSSGLALHLYHGSWAISRKGCNVIETFDNFTNYAAYEKDVRERAKSAKAAAFLRSLLATAE